MKVFKVLIAVTILTIALAIPSFVQAAGTVCTPCTATWTASAATDNVTGYKLYLLTSPTGTAVQNVNIGLTATPTAPSANLATTFTLTNGTQYYLYVTSVNIVGESAPSATVPFVYQNTVPGAVQGLTVK